MDRQQYKESFFSGGCQENTTISSLFRTSSCRVCSCAGSESGRYRTCTRYYWNLSGVGSGTCVGNCAFLSQQSSNLGARAISENEVGVKRREFVGISRWKKRYLQALNRIDQSISSHEFMWLSQRISANRMSQIGRSARHVLFLQKAFGLFEFSNDFPLILTDDQYDSRKFQKND